MKLVFTDLDGTLFDNDSKISEYTKNAILRLKQKGYIFVVVSGRCFSSLKTPLKEDIALFDFFISNNGATINSKNDLLVDERFNREIVVNLYNLFHEKVEGFNFYVDDKGYSLKKAKLITTSSPKPLVTLRDIPDNVNKVLLIAENKVLEKIKPDVLKLGLNAFFSLDRFLDIMPQSVSKASAINYLIAQFKDVEKVYIFGDYENDIEMLSLDYETVAMLNGIDKVKKCAKYISKYPNYQDGVVRFLEDEDE